MSKELDKANRLAKNDKFQGINFLDADGNIARGLKQSKRVKLLFATDDVTLSMAEFDTMADVKFNLEKNGL